MANTKLYVGNLEYSVTEEQLTTLFATYGAVKQVNIIEGRGFGFVEMADPEGAENAKNALNEADFQGRTLKVNEARAQAPRRREYDGGGGYGDNRRGGSSRGGFGGGRGGQGGAGGRGGRSPRRSSY